jgi:hypothetical protein
LRRELCQVVFVHRVAPFCTSEHEPGGSPRG